MISTKNYFRTKDNIKIYYGEYYPQTDMKAILFFIHGIYETFEVYENLARLLVRNNIGFISFDYRGLGKSEGKRGFVDSVSHWIDDIEKLFHITERHRTKDIPLFYCAYSMGSLIGLRHILEKKPVVSGIILAATGYNFQNILLYLCMFGRFINRYFPNCYLKPPDFHSIMRSQKNMFSQNKKTERNRLYPSIGGALLECRDYIHNNFEKIDIPFYLQCSKTDSFFKQRLKLLQSIYSKDKSITVYENCKHDIYKEVIKTRRKVFSDLIEWINYRIV